MASQKQVDANRANALRSTGPRTPDGKSRSRMNAVTHGLTAKAVVIGDERPEDFEALHDAVIEYFRPNSELGNDAAERYAATLWRLRRIPAIEAALAKAACDKAYVNECDRLEREHEQEINEEAQERCIAEYNEDPTKIAYAHATGAYDDRVWEISNELLSERPFQVPERKTLPSAQALCTLIETAASFDVLSKLSRYEANLVNLASRQRRELEEFRSAGEDAKIINP